jgi:Cd2+/Zn2+-exporting ATPase
MQNVIMALSIKLAVLALGLLGLAGMWEAVFADVGAALLAVFNSMRVLKGNT